MKNSRQLGKKPQPPKVPTLAAVTAPYYAKLGRTVRGLPRQYIEDAFDDARALGLGATVVSSEGTVLARWVAATSSKW
jgi:hypothetical protein